MTRWTKWGAGVAIAAGLALAGLAAAWPWMRTWGATPEEIAASYPGDELVPHPARVLVRAVTIEAPPERVFPWLRQLGADKGGLYSYTWLEAAIRCPMTNADRVHPEWQALEVGDLVKLCPADPAPPPYVVARIDPDRALVLGHREGDRWVDLWQLVLRPGPDGSTRLVLRTRTEMTGGMWDVIQPVVFVMERAMLLGIRDRAERVSPPG